MSKTLSAAMRQMGYEDAKRSRKIKRQRTYNRRCATCTATFTHKGRQCSNCEVAAYLMATGQA